MQEQLKAWFNGGKNYGKGVALYCLYGADVSFKKILLQGATPFTAGKLETELLKLHKQEEMMPKAAVTEQQALGIAINAELLKSADDEAKASWKAMMNKRAVLFQLCKCASWEDENEPGKVAVRGKLAIEILQDNKGVNRAYERLHAVRTTGRLPGDDVQVQDEYSLLPDSLVKQKLDNHRKAYNKLKDKPTNSKRVALMQEHTKAITKLEERWRCLK